jgi:hypothetical protein
MIAHRAGRQRSDQATYEGATQRISRAHVAHSSTIISSRRAGKQSCGEAASARHRASGGKMSRSLRSSALSTPNTQLVFPLLAPSPFALAVPYYSALDTGVIPFNGR